MTKLSPAAQAVLDAANAAYDDVATVREGTASALRAAADQVVPREAVKDRNWVSDAYKQRMDTRAYLLAIADELEGFND